MRTNIVIDEKLTNEAFALTGLKTKRELIDFALKELVRIKKETKGHGLCDAFEELHKLQLDDNPFPDIERKDRPNPFADER